MDDKEISKKNTNEDNGIEKPLDKTENPAVFYLAGLSKSGRRVQANALNTIANLLMPGSDYLTFPWVELEYKHVLLLRAGLQNRYGSSTVNRMLSAIRGTLKNAFMLDLIPAKQYMKIKEVKDMKRLELPAGRYINDDEMEAILNGCISNDEPAGFRDAAIISCMVAGGGLRRSEVAILDLSDYNSLSGQMRIVGKGNKERTCYIVNGAADAMADWLTIRGDEPGPLFIPINKGGELVFRSMSNQAIYYILKRRAAKAGVENITPHDLRRTFISNLLEAGVDIATISQIVGHQDVKTTAQYDRRPEEAKKKAIERLSIPYKRRLG